MPDGAAFCEECGTKVTEEETVRYESKNIKFCADGKYRWMYEYPMMKKNSIIITVWKVLALACFAPALLTFILKLTDGDGFVQAIKEFGIVYGACIGIMTVLCVIAYFILAAIYGWKYIVLFEMDENGVVHAQQQKQYKKAQAIGWLTAVAGASAKNLTVAGTGILAATRSSMSSDFSKVKYISGSRKQNTIFVDEPLAKNQVYVADEDYDFVWRFITSNCPKAKIK